MYILRRGGALQAKGLNRAAQAVRGGGGGGVFSLRFKDFNKVDSLTVKVTHTLYQGCNILVYIADQNNLTRCVQEWIVESWRFYFYRR